MGHAIIYREFTMNHHHHHHDAESTLTFEEKLDKLLDHWIKHNVDHAATYRDWKSKIESAGLETVAQHLEKAATMTEEMNSVFEAAKAALTRLS